MVRQDLPVEPEITPGAGLTPIHRRIHCGATNDADDNAVDNENELDGLAINHFLDTLAEVSLAIGRRKC